MRHMKKVVFNQADIIDALTFHAGEKELIARTDLFSSINWQEIGSHKDNLEITLEFFVDRC
jgi:hypothetical protein